MHSSPSEFPWTSPPWLGGATKYRMGLRPIKPNRWFQGRPSLRLRVHKYGMLRRNYPQVVQTLPNTNIPQRLLANKMKEHGWFQPELQPTNIFPDLVAGLSLQVADDLCLLETSGEQRFIAGSVCSPSYWNIQEKIGLSMAAIHQPVTTLETKIGEQIRRFIRHSPVMTPFERSNWFVHGDRERLHLSPEAAITTQPHQWFVRSERETLCRFAEEFLLFTINVRFAPLRDISRYPEALVDLQTSLKTFDSDEIEYFGGRQKFDRLCNYLSAIGR